jgi:hypothetical protein
MAKIPPNWQKISILLDVLPSLRKGESVPLLNKWVKNWYLNQKGKIIQQNQSIRKLKIVQGVLVKIYKIFLQVVDF